MSKYALVKDGKVVNVISGNNLSEDILASLKTDHSVDNIFLVEDEVTVRIDDTYDGTDFIPPKPFTSWTWNSTNKEWEAPIPAPTTGPKGSYAEWNESTGSWDIKTHTV